MCREAEINSMEVGMGRTCGGLNYQHPNSVTTVTKASLKLLVMVWAGPANEVNDGCSPLHLSSRREGRERDL